MDLWSGARELYFSLREYGGDRAYDEIIFPWLVEGREGYCAELAPLATFGQVPGGPDRREGYWLAIPYALSRVSDVLLLGFQPDLGPGMDTPWAHQLHLVGNAWPAVTREQYLDLFSALGMIPVAETRFDPFLHEIVEVDQAEDPDAPITVTELVWPGLMLGQLMFARAGVRIRAGANHAQRDVADRSPLYATFLRRHRPTIDPSLGWGHNSQWDTDFRRDYRTDHAVHLNIDATGQIDVPGLEDEINPLLTIDERRDLLRHRCLLRTPDAALALAGKDPYWQTNLWPYDWKLTIPPHHSDCFA